MLRSLLKEALQAVSPILDFFRRAIEPYWRKRSLSAPPDLSKLLLQMLNVVNCDFFLIIDGLDKYGCDPRSKRRQALLQVPQEWVNSGFGNLHLLMLSKK